MPYDALVRAHQKGGDFARDAEEMAMISVRRTIYVVRRRAVLIVLGIGFVLAVLATFAFLGYEMSLAALSIAFPLVIVSTAEVFLAFRIEREGLAGEILRDALTRRRFWNQVIGLVSIFVAAIFTFLSLARHVVLYY